MESVGQGQHDELHITVEKRDRSVAGELLSVLPSLVNEAEHPLQQGTEWRCGMNLAKRCIEDLDQNREQRRTEGVVELKGQAIDTRACTSVSHPQSQSKFFGRQQTVTVHSLGHGCVDGRQGAGKRLQEVKLVGRVDICSRAEEAEGGV